MNHSYINYHLILTNLERVARLGAPQSAPAAGAALHQAQVTLIIDSDADFGGEEGQDPFIFV